MDTIARYNLQRGTAQNPRFSSTTYNIECPLDKMLLSHLLLSQNIERNNDIQKAQEEFAKGAFEMLNKELKNLCK